MTTLTFQILRTIIYNVNELNYVWQKKVSLMIIKLRGIIWLDSVIEKINAKHGISREEVNQVLQSRAMFRFVEKGHRRGENVYAVLGQTKAGRYLIVFFIQKSDNRILILTARNMTVAERKRYEKKQ